MYNKRETKLFLINSCEEIKLLGYEKEILSTGTISSWTILFTSMWHGTHIPKRNVLSFERSDNFANP